MAARAPSRSARARQAAGSSGLAMARSSPSRAKTWRCCIQALMADEDPAARQFRPQTGTPTWQRASTNSSAGWRPLDSRSLTRWCTAWSMHHSMLQFLLSGWPRRWASRGLAARRTLLACFSPAMCCTIPEAAARGPRSSGRASRSCCRRPARSWGASGCGRFRARRSGQRPRTRSARCSERGRSGVSSRCSSPGGSRACSSPRSLRLPRRKLPVSPTSCCARCSPSGLLA
mmetsp:Transcript_62809/g.178420  ORF Transcript_62809/g.178420 Transcript_62809/m.178420 type:complete len:231 (-) Transcript_62809:653-1345(-)